MGCKASLAAQHRRAVRRGSCPWRGPARSPTARRGRVSQRCMTKNGIVPAWARQAPRWTCANSWFAAVCSCSSHRRQARRIQTSHAIQTAKPSFIRLSFGCARSPNWGHTTCAFGHEERTGSWRARPRLIIPFPHRGSNHPAALPHNFPHRPAKKSRVAATHILSQGGRGVGLRHVTSTILTTPL